MQVLNSYTFKLILLCVIFASFCYIGLQIAFSYKRKQNFFESLINFCNHLKTEIGFSKLEILKIIEKYKHTYSKEFRTVLEQFPYVKTEYDVINHFFNNLGKFDSKTELANIDAAMVVFNSLLKDSTEKTKKNYSTSIKLCVLLGIGLVIVLI